MRNDTVTRVYFRTDAASAHLAHSVLGLDSNCFQGTGFSFYKQTMPIIFFAFQYQDQDQDPLDLQARTSAQRPVQRQQCGTPAVQRSAPLPGLEVTVDLRAREAPANPVMGPTRPREHAVAISAVLSLHKSLPSAALQQSFLSLPFAQFSSSAADCRYRSTLRLYRRD